MKVNPQKWRALLIQGWSKLATKSGEILDRIEPGNYQNNTDIYNFDESILQQGRFWIRTVTWTLVGSSVFAVAWLSLAHTEEIVIATCLLYTSPSPRD